jgi:hypothetical protein
MTIYSKFHPPAGYYVYAYLRNDGSPYYIGKGTKQRAWDKNHSVSIPKNQSKITILEANLTDVGAFALERRYIKWYGRKDLKTGILRNKTEGGEGPSSDDRKGTRNPMFGRAQSNKQKQHQSEIMKGIHKSATTRIKMSQSKKGKYEGAANPNLDNKRYTFFNQVTGECITCTQYELRIKYNLDQSSVSRLVTKKYRSTKNWIIII